MRLAWTGHRPDLFADPEAARRAVDDTARDVLPQGPLEQFLVGGQRGVDTWAAHAAIDLAIPFRLFLPLSVEDFTVDWTEADRAILRDHAEQAAEVRVARGYSARNRLLASECDLLVAVWTGRAGGGTAETIAFARELGTPVRQVRLLGAATQGSIAGRGI
jgi:hypothetical protein